MKLKIIKLKLYKWKLKIISRPLKSEVSLGNEMEAFLNLSFF